MRRIDLHPKRKLRNPARHLRNLKKWSENVHIGLKEKLLASDDCAFWKIKLPVYAKLCDPQKTKPEYQKACVEALIAAAQKIRANVVLDRPYVLAVLFVTPYMHQSEVTLFFDDGYLRSFFPTGNCGVSENEVCKVTSMEPQLEQVEALGLSIPNEFELLGGYRLIEEDKFGGTPDDDRNHWIIVERQRDTATLANAAG